VTKFAILKLIKPAPWTEEGEITVNVAHVAAIEVETGCGGRFTRLTLCTGREVCVRGKAEDVRREIAKLAGQGRPRPLSLFEEVFGPGRDEPKWRGWRR